MRETSSDMVGVKAQQPSNTDGLLLVRQMHED
jgi:hypothetical protein